MSGLRSSPRAGRYWLAAAALGLASAAGCGTDFTSCEDTRSCTDTDTVGDTSTGGIGSTGTGGSSSASSTTGSSATTNQGGTAGTGGSVGDSTSGGAGGAFGGFSGASGAAGSPACDGACEGETPVCHEASDTCVECLQPKDCDEGVCDTDAHACVECLDSEQCEAPTGHCDSEQQLCVECLVSGDCTDPQASFCDSGSCTPCQTNDDCTHLTGTTVCDVGVGECVECTGTDYASCGLNDENDPLVCNSLTHTCTDQVEHGSGLCESCLSDANCALGQRCVLQTFAEQEVGYFCFWEQGASEGGAPESCGTARPYFDTLADATSIDGAVADICGLRTSTCVARAQFSTKECGTATPDDSLCGVAPPADAVCAEAATNVHLCTMTCGSDVDCPSGFPCNTAVDNPYCEL